MNKSLVSRRYLSEVTRGALYLDCLNRKFDNVLKVVRSTPAKEMDYAFLQTYLSRSCQWGHIDSVSHIWYRFVMRHNMVVIKPSLLCDIGNLALNEGKHFIPGQLYRYFVKFYGKTLTMEQRQAMEYELLRIKVESFAKGTMNKTSFREKWKVFLEDIDHRFPPSMVFRARDFPNLGNSLRHEQYGSLLTLLLGQNKIDINNGSTAPLLLNLILMYSLQGVPIKLDLFEKFHGSHRMLSYDDTLAILLRLCRNDPYDLSKLTKYADDNELMLPSSHGVKSEAI